MLPLGGVDCLVKLLRGISTAANAKSEFRLLNGGKPIIIGDIVNDPDGRNMMTLGTPLEGEMVEHHCAVISEK